MLDKENAKIVDAYMPYFIGMFMSGAAFIGGLVFGLVVHPIGLIVTVGGIIGMLATFIKSNKYILKLHGKSTESGDELS